MTTTNVKSALEDSAFREAMRVLLEFDEKETALDKLVHLTIAGIRQVEYFPRLLEALPEEERVEGTEGHQKYLAAKEQSELATSELTEDFPLLHAQAVITLWGALEAVVRNLFASLLENVPRTRETDAFAKIRVRVTEYEALQGVERYLFLVDCLEEVLSTRRKVGIERFEILFRELGMSSPVERDVVTCLLELYHFRNVLVHRHGRIDRRLLMDCPWLSLTEGTALCISHRQYKQYKVALSLYLLVIVNRVRVYFGLEPVDHAPECSFATQPFTYDPTLVRSQTRSQIGGGGSR